MTGRMRIHTDKLKYNDLWRVLPTGCALEITKHGSRKRARAFEVKMAAAPGHDKHGIKRAYARNSGDYGAEHEHYRAATYIEWGDWMVGLLKIDPEAIIGPYDGSEGFMQQTQQFAPHRPARENAEQHADRWSSDLYYAVGVGA